MSERGSKLKGWFHESDAWCLEPLWGALEMLTFFLMVNTGVAVLCAVFYYLLYMFTFNTDLLFKVHIHGLSGYLAGENQPQAWYKFCSTELNFALGLERSVSKLYPSRLLELLYCTASTGPGRSMILVLSNVLLCFFQFYGSFFFLGYFSQYGGGGQS